MNRQVILSKRDIDIIFMSLAKRQKAVREWGNETGNIDNYKLATAYNAEIDDLMARIGESPECELPALESAAV